MIFVPLRPSAGLPKLCSSKVVIGAGQLFTVVVVARFSECNGSIPVHDQAYVLFSAANNEGPALLNCGAGAGKTVCHCAPSLEATILMYWSALGR